ncbi:inositol monophosphatase family protein [Shouchella shacheensis]|uniref:inositol monophosphatase family protein n=1 Tax=Shouchella shacheensis TaxID=1649580 RepID=UPI00073FF9B4|nr:inositol monophosphatase family protein [Shouchella shacheensis]
MTERWMSLERVARLWIVEAGDLIKEALKNPFDIDSKSDPDDLVTEVDRNTEAFFYHKIKENFPDHQFLGEEGVAKELQSLKGTVWIVDPIDGTMNFVHQQVNFSISVGIYEEGKGVVGLVYDVMNGELFHAVRDRGVFLNDRPLKQVTDRSISESILGLNANWLVEDHHQEHEGLVRLAQDCRGTRSYGSAAIEMAYVAADRLDAYISLRLSPWDYAGGAVLLEEAGCKATRLDGEELSMLEKGSMIACKPELHTTIVADYLEKG